MSSSRQRRAGLKTHPACGRCARRSARTRNSSRSAGLAALSWSGLMNTLAKSDLAARPVSTGLRDSIEAHLTVVFAALAVSREAQARTGMSINKIVKTLRPLRTATITLGRQQINAEPRIPAPAQQILNDLAHGGH